MYTKFIETLQINILFPPHILIVILNLIFIASGVSLAFATTFGTTLDVKNNRLTQWVKKQMYQKYPNTQVLSEIDAVDLIDDENKHDVNNISDSLTGSYVYLETKDDTNLSNTENTIIVENNRIEEFESTSSSSSSFFQQNKTNLNLPNNSGTPTPVVKRRAKKQSPTNASINNRISKVFETPIDSIKYHNKIKGLIHHVKMILKNYFSSSKLKSNQTLIENQHKCHASVLPAVTYAVIKADRVKEKLLVEIHKIDTNDKDTCDSLLQKVYSTHAKYPYIRRVEYAFINECINCDHTLLFLAMEENAGITLNQWIMERTLQDRTTVNTKTRDREIERKIANIIRQCVKALIYLSENYLNCGGIDADTIYIKNGSIKIGHVTSFEAFTDNNKLSKINNDIIALKNLLEEMAKYLLSSNSKELADFLKVLQTNTENVNTKFEYSELLKKEFLEKSGSSVHLYKVARNLWKKYDLPKYRYK